MAQVTKEEGKCCPQTQQLIFPLQHFLPHKQWYYALPQNYWHHDVNQKCIFVKLFETRNLSGANYSFGHNLFLVEIGCVISDNGHNSLTFGFEPSKHTCIIVLLLDLSHIIFFTKASTYFASLSADVGSRDIIKG